MIRERLTGVGVALLGLLILFVLIPWGIDRPGNVEHAALAPDFWPRIIAAAMMVMGVLLAAGPVPEEDDTGVEDAGVVDGFVEKPAAGEVEDTGGVEDTGVADGLVGKPAAGEVEDTGGVEDAGVAGRLVGKPAAGEVEDTDGGGDAGPWRRRLPGLAAVLGTLFGFCVLIPSLGMVVPGMALIAGLTVLAGERRWPLVGVIAAGVPILLYAFFVHVAGIPIPLGVFETLRG